MEPILWYEPPCPSRSAVQHSQKQYGTTRASRSAQGESGLGLEGQRKAVADYLNGGRWELAAEFTETESGKSDLNRPALQEALAACRR